MKSTPNERKPMLDATLIPARERHLAAVVAAYFAKRNRGSWYRSAVKIAIRELRDERGDSNDRPGPRFAPDQIAARRIAALDGDDDAYFARRDELREQLDRLGLSVVATAELRLLEESCAQIEDAHDAQHEDEIQAESAWLRAAEYDPRMDDPREW